MITASKVLKKTITLKSYECFFNTIMHMNVKPGKSLTRHRLSFCFPVFL